MSHPGTILPVAPCLQKSQITSTSYRKLPRGDPGRLSGAQIQTCIVHLLRHSLDLASHKDRKAATTALRLLFLVLNRSEKDRTTAHA